METDAAVSIISAATARNWTRLNQGPQKLEDRLTRRANKRKSTKNIFPKEYLLNPSNIEAVLNILDLTSISNETVKGIICSLCVNLLVQNKLLKNVDGSWESSNSQISLFSNEIVPYIITPLLDITLPAEETDIIGIIYQCLLSEGDKNIQGSYFTPRNIIRELINTVNVTKHTNILDPCCGTGSFLINIEGSNPENLYGIDIDPIAVIIAKTNLFIKFNEQEFSPKIYCGDFLTLNHTLYDVITGLPEQFDAIISNPPWGATITKDYHRYYPDITSGETFSFFIRQSIQKLKHNGQLCFLLPESILNVGAHQDIRKYMLDHTSIQRITLFGRAFSGVFTSVTGIELVNSSNKDNIVSIKKNDQLLQCPQNYYLCSDHYIFSIISKMDQEIIDKVYEQPYQTLTESKWALGIVTGNNKDKVRTTLQPGMEPIYTGKEVQRYTLKKSTSFILYDRSGFQQVAPDDFYRADEKLVYKFISNRLVFAYDKSGSLFLNSANILIPKIEGMSVKTVLAFLNSTMMQFLYHKKFGEIKILRGNLEKLPFPCIDPDLDSRFVFLVDAVMSGDLVAHDKIQKLVYDIWKLSKSQILYIEEAING